MGREDSGWHRESRRHALSQKGIETKAEGQMMYSDGRNKASGLTDSQIQTDKEAIDQLVSKIMQLDMNDDLLEENRITPEELGFPEGTSNLNARIRLAEQKRNLEREIERIIEKGTVKAFGRVKTDREAIDFLSKKPLSDLRRRQDILNNMIKTASERRMSESLAKLQIREWHLQQAVLKKTFPEDYEFDHPNHILELKKILGIKKDELGDLD